MSLGYALVHPVLVDATASANPWRASFDDGVDVVMSVFGAGDLSPYAAAFESALDEQIDEIGAQVAGLVAPGGPLEMLTGLADLLDGDLDVAGMVRTAGEVLCDLDPAVAAGLLSGIVDDLAVALPLLSPADLVPRIVDLADALLGVLEAPLLSGRDDLEAHRAYRAAAVIRAQIGPMVDRLGEMLAGIDVAAFVRGFLGDASASAELDVEPIRRLGCLLAEDIAPILEGVFGCAAGLRLDVDVGGGGDGPFGMPKVATLADDGHPAPFPPRAGMPDTLLWALDLSTNLLSLAATVANIVLTGNPPRRVAHFLSDLLLPTWIAFRTLARAVRWDFLDESRFTRFLFGEWGDFSAQLLIRVIGSFSDAFAFSNWISTVGLSLMKYHILTLQPRSIYQYARSLWYVDRWHDLDPETRPGVPVHRFVWLAYTPAMFVGFLLGVIYGGALTKYLSVRRIALPLGLGGGLALVSLLLAFPIYGVGLSDLAWPAGTGMLLGGAAVLLLLIGVLQFSQVAEFEQNPGGQAALWVVFAVLTVVVIVAISLTATGTYEGLSTGLTAFLLLLPGAVVAGGLPQLLWWYVLAEGADLDGVFGALDASTSPYLLPFPSSEDWMCGQDNHGFWSHQAHDEGGFEEDFNDGNRYSFDFNHDRGSHCLAARAGLVCDIRDDVATGDPGTPRRANRVQVQHLDWAEGHDPGWDAERAVTYSEYLHVEQRGVRASLAQLVERGHFLALLDDTGNSAMEHLHFSGNSGQNQPLASGALTGTDNLPVVFADGGKVTSLTFPSSSNTEVDGDRPVGRTFPLVAATDGHVHQVVLSAADLAADGTVPASLALVSSRAAAAGAAPHVHELTLTAAQIGQLLETRDVAATTTSVSGHTHALAPLGPQTGLVSAPGGRVTAGTPPPGRLLAREAGPYDLLGEQLFLRVNDRATEWFTWGVHRPAIVGTLALDRGPAPGAEIDVTAAGTNPITTATHVMARAGAAQLQADAEAAGLGVAVRVLPVLVVETRRRGTSASLAVPGVPAGLRTLTAGDGSGDVADLSLSPADLRARITADLTQQAGVPTATVTGAGSSRTIQLNGTPVTDVAGSTPRIEAVLGPVLAAGAITDRDPLPLSTGLLRLRAGGDVLDVAIVGAPARAVIPDLAAARLTGADLVAEPLVVTVRDDAQSVVFDPADDSPDGIARRISSAVEGVRAEADGAGVVIETVAAGNAATLVLAKGAAVFPPVPSGAAPPLGAGVQLADSTSVSLAELTQLVRSAQAEAVRPTAPATIGGSGATVRIEATAGAGTPVAVEGPRDLMAALGVAAATPTASTSRVDGDGAVELTGLPAPIDLPSGGWLDVTVGADTWRVSLTAEPARAELALDALPPGGSQLRLEVNGSAVPVDLAAADVVSRHALAARIAAASPAVTVRTAYRYAFERSVHGRVGAGPGGTLEITTTAAATGTLVVGIPAGTETRDVRAAHVDATAVTQLDPVATRPGALVRAFSAAIAGAGTPDERVEISSADGGELGIVALGSDPLGLLPAPPPPAPVREVRGAPIDLGAASVAYDVTAAGTTTTVELNAAPAHVSATLPGALALPDGADPVLGVVTTDPGGTSRRVDVDLTGVASLGDVAARLQQEAPHVTAWSSNGGNRLDVDTPGGGTGWRLRLEGRAVLLCLGIPADRIDATGGVDAVGHGTVADGSAVGLAELAGVFDAIGGLATRDPNQAYTVDVAGPTLTVASEQGAVALRSDPPTIASALAATTVGDVVQITGAPLALDSGWLFVDVDGTALGAALLEGRRAWVESDPVSDADVTGFTGAIRVRINAGPTVSVVVASPPATVADLVDLLSRSLPAAWIGHVRRSDGTRVLRVESRTRGSASAVRVELPAAALGFPAAVTQSPAGGPGSGGGSVADLAQVTLAELETLLDGGRGTSGAPQQVIDASAAAGTLRLVARGGSGVTASLAAPGRPPDGLVPVAVPGRADVVEMAYPAPIDTGPNAAVVVLTRPAGVAVTRPVRAVLRAAPARLGDVTLPAALGDLDGRSLRLSVDGTTVDVAFSGVTSAADVIAQAQRGADWRIRATVAPGPPARLRLETATEGTAASLSVVPDPAVSTVFAVAGAPSPATAAGSGDTANVRAVPAADWAAAIDRGLLGPDPTADASAPPLPVALLQGSRGTTAGPFFHGRQSNRVGCDSAIAVVPAAGAAGTFAETLAAGPAALRLDRSGSRGPAVRAAVALPAFVDATGAPAERDLRGSLGLTFDDHGAGTDIAPASTVTVDFDGRFDAAAAAAVLDAALSARGVGHAAAYPDGVVVVETLTTGLAGRVTVPAPSAPGDAAVLDALGLDPATPLDARGWPVNGFRSAVTTALADASWRFAVPIPGSVPANLAVTAGQTAAVAATALNAQLRDPTGTLPPTDGRNRVGLAVVDADGALLVETFGGGAPTFTLAGTPLGVDPPPQRWLGTEPRVDPAFELRPTTQVRTFRMVYVTGEGGREVFCDPAVFDTPDPTAGDFRRFDVGWVRPPTDNNGTEQNLARWAAGRWLLSARMAGARSDVVAGDERTPGYAPAGEMIVSGGSATGPDGQVMSFPHRVRYWLSLTHSFATVAPLRVVRVGDELLVDHLIRPR